VGKEGGVDTPPSSAARTAASKLRPASTPAKVAPSAGIAGGRLTAVKPAGKKAARSGVTGAAVPPDRPPEQEEDADAVAPTPRPHGRRGTYGGAG